MKRKVKVLLVRRSWNRIQLIVLISKNNTRNRNLVTNVASKDTQLLTVLCKDSNCHKHDKKGDIAKVCCTNRANCSQWVKVKESFGVIF